MLRHFRKNFARSLMATLSRKIWAMPLGVFISCAVVSLTFVLASA